MLLSTDPVVVVESGGRKEEGRKEEEHGGLEGLLKDVKLEEGGE